MGEADDQNLIFDDPIGKVDRRHFLLLSFNLKITWDFKWHFKVVSQGR